MSEWRGIRNLDGSIRVPSHFCGIYGHRPSYGLMPLRRHVPPLPGKLNRFELGVAGPMAHSAFDLELALDLLISPAALERKAWRIELPASRRDKLSDFRVAVWADDSEFSVDSGVRTAIETCVDWA